MSSTSRNVRLGDIVLLETTHNTGMVEFRVDPNDIAPERVWLEDAVGRRILVTAHESTVMIMMPVGEIGALMYDPEIDMSVTPPAPRRHEGKRCYKQRNTLSNLDVLNLIQQVLRNRDREGSRIALFGTDGKRV